MKSSLIKCKKIIIDQIKTDNCAWLLIIMGLVVIVGWYLNNSYLVQIHPSFVPMQFNTALGFLLCGVMLNYISKNKNRPALILSLIVILLGVLTLCQYIFQVDFGIDELFMDHSILTKTSHAGRMAPNTALCFSLSGLSILLLMLLNNKHKNKVVVISGSLIFSLGMVALIGYISGIDTAYGWSNLTRMAFHTSIGFLIMGAGIVIFIWRNELKDNLVLPDWMHMVVLITALTVTVSLWQALHTTELRQIKIKTEQLSSHIKHYFNSSFDSQVSALKRLADRWEYNGKTPREIWEADALSYYEDYKIFQAIEWVDTSSHVRWVVPLEGNESIVDMDVFFGEERISALKNAKENDQITVSEIFKLKQTGEYGFLVYFPLFIDEGFDGYIAAVYSLEKLFNKLLIEQLEEGYQFYLKHGNEITYTSHTNNLDVNIKDVYEIDLYVKNKNWILYMIVPEQKTSVASGLILAIGVILSILLGFATWLVRKVFLDRKRLKEYADVLKSYTNEVHASKQELQGVLDSAVDAIISIDDKGIIATVNQACLEIFGYQEGELVGNNIKMLMPSPYHEGHDSYLKNYHETGDKKIIGIGREVIGRRKDGSEFPIELSVSENQTISGHTFTGILRDISERKEALRNLSIQKEYYESLIHNLNVPAFILNTSHKVIIWNKACEEMTGVLSEDVIGTSDHWRGFYNENRPLLADIVLDQSFEQIDDLYEIELENSFIEGGRHIQNWCPIPVKGTPLYLAIDAGPIFDKEGNLVAIVEVLKDITKLKQVQDALEKRQQELERSNTELQRFAYVASHDLQEPLRMVSSFTQLLADRYKDKLDEQANEFIDFAVDGAKRMQSLIQDLLLLSRVDRKEEPFEKCSGNKLYEYAVLNLQMSINETQTELECGELPDVYGDEIQLIQLFQNLIGNAVKYRDLNRTNLVKVYAKTCNEHWKFFIEDNGIGISSEFYEKVFQIFKRLHTKHDYSGTGIGLALCKKIIERHGGEIGVDSKPGEGSIFYFTLPKKNIFPDGKSNSEFDETNYV
jgi:PAS domain S-box-containing protein